MFTGEYKHSLDPKNRLIIPSRLRSSLGDTFVLTRGLEKCISIYTKEAWQKQEAQLAKLPQTNKSARAYVRFLTSGATECSFDNQGRIQLPASLITYANIQKSCAIIGAGSNVEIWDEATWDQYNAATAESFDEVAEQLTEFLQ